MENCEGPSASRILVLERGWGSDADDGGERCGGWAVADSCRAQGMRTPYLKFFFLAYFVPIYMKLPIWKRLLKCFFDQTHEVSKVKHTHTQEPRNVMKSGLAATAGAVNNL